MKVLLRRGRHSLYNSFIESPPKGVEYITPNNTTSPTTSVIRELKIKSYFLYLDALSYPNVIRVDAGEADLIHSGGGFFVKNQKNWVAGPVEHVGDFLGNRKGWFKKIRKKRYQKNIEKEIRNPYCKKIMPYAHAGKLTITRFLPEDLHYKIEVVRLAFKCPKKVKRKKKNKVTFLFMGSNNFPTNFEVKGGNETLEAFDMISDKYDCELLVRSVLSADIHKQYSKNDKIRFIQDTLTWEEIQRLYRTADVFVHPSYVTPGSVFLEAMGFSLPIITSDVWANTEMVCGDVNGYVVDRPRASFYDNDGLTCFDDWGDLVSHIRKTDTHDTSKQIAEKMTLLIENRSLRRKMGERGRRMVEDGKFSIKERNKKLKKVYAEALEQ